MCGCQLSVRAVKQPEKDHYKPEDQADPHLSSWPVVAVLPLTCRWNFCPRLGLSWEEFGSWDCGEMCKTKVGNLLVLGQM